MSLKLDESLFDVLNIFCALRSDSSDTCGDFLPDARENPAGALVPLKSNESSSDELNIFCTLRRDSSDA